MELTTKYVMLGLYGIKPEKHTVIPIIPTFINQNCVLAKRRLWRKAWANEGTKRYDRPKIIIATKPYSCMK
jgi:hypothetical protein